MNQLLTKKMKTTKNNKGFTLIELIVVIAILGILAAIAIPRFAGIRENANESAVIANLRTFQGAAEMYASTNNVEIADVDTAKAVTMLDGVALTGPGTTTYAMSAGVATATVDASIPYPSDGVTKYTEIASN